MKNVTKITHELVLGNLEMHATLVTDKTTTNKKLTRRDWGQCRSFKLLYANNFEVYENSLKANIFPVPEGAWVEIREFVLRYNKLHNHLNTWIVE